jgi:FkbM family methyltransferase
VADLARLDVDFLGDFSAELMRNSVRHGRDNIDRIRFSVPAPPVSVKDRVLKIAALHGFYRPTAAPTHKIREILEIPGLAQAYSLFADDASKQLLLKLLAYRALGLEQVVLPLNTEKFWQLRKSTGAYLRKKNAIANIPLLGSLDLYDFEGIQMYAHRLNIETAFQLEQYRHPKVGVHPGDVVIDAGACWGDTALYFAAQKAQKVICFECMPSNLHILRKNLALNPSLAKRIEVLPKAVWDSSHQIMQFEDRGPGSVTAASGPTVRVETLTIDDAIASLKPPLLGDPHLHVDFVKMDIEGAEPRALIGAEKTIRKYRPRLAISIYHDVCHFAEIPNWIHSLDLGYKFFLGHATIHAEETVLFAHAED